MKLKSKILSIITLTMISLCSLPALAQTAEDSTNSTPVVAVPPPFLSFNWITNIPTATNFQVATIGVGVGVLERAGNFENYIKGDIYIRTNWMVSAEIQNSPSASVVDSFGIYAGYRKAWPNAELSLSLGPRRTFTTDATGTHPNWQGVLLIEGAWLPMTGGKFMLTGGLELATSQHGDVFNERPSMGFRLGTKLLF